MKLTRRAAISAVVLLSLACIPTSPTDKPGWEIIVHATSSNATGSTPGVVVVGDSLIWWAGTQTLADMIRFWRGTSSVVVGAAGASWAHFNSPTLVGPYGLGTLQNYADFFKPRVLVVALGSNDARIIHAERNDPYGYRIGEFENQAGVATLNMLGSARCVALINVADHWSDASTSQIIDDVNLLLDGLDFVSPNVFTFDWDAHSAGHPEWFDGAGNIHHTPAGMAAYRNFINDAVWHAMNAGC